MVSLLLSNTADIQEIPVRASIHRTEIYRKDGFNPTVTKERDTCLENITLGH